MPSLSSSPGMPSLSSSPGTPRVSKTLQGEETRIDGDTPGILDEGTTQQYELDEFTMMDVDTGDTGVHCDNIDGFEQYVDLALADCANVHKIQPTLFVVQGWDGVQLTVSASTTTSMIYSRL